MRWVTFLYAICFSALSYAQFSFSGYINPNTENQAVYLSIIDDYRKISGVYSEQIIAKTTANNNGFFEFKGNMLETENRIYRIHIDECPETEQSKNHFNGHCNNSEELVFIAKNTDTLKLPFSFGKQVFCKVESNNPRANALVKIDSLKDDMRFAYSEFRSQANRKLNNKKWFKILQDYGEAINEPLAELYIYAYLSDRRNDFHNYYVEDLKTNTYYNRLQQRLTQQYPNATYTKQFINEIEADRYMLSASKPTSNQFWQKALLGVLVFSVLLNLILIYKFWKQKKVKTKTLKQNLSKQELVVLEHLLDGKSNKAIANTLFLSLSTIKSHTNNIYKKLNVQSRDQVKQLFNN